MHEVAAIQAVVRTALEYMRQADAARVTNVQLSVSVSGHFTEDIVHQYFTVFTAGTPDRDRNRAPEAGCAGPRIGRGVPALCL